MKLHHVSLKTPQLEVLASFYRNVFFCKIVHIFHNNRGVYGFLLQFPEGGFIEILQSDVIERTRDLNVDHFAVQVTSIFQFCESSRPFFPSDFPTPRRGRTDNVLSLSISDPDGNTVEIQQLDEHVKYSPNLPARV